MKRKLSGIRVKLILYFMIAICLPIGLIAIDVVRTTEITQNDNMKLTSKQTLQETKKGFVTYLKTLSQPVDLLTRKNEVKHLEDQGVLATNIAAVQDSLIASVKVTNGSARAFYTTKTGHKIVGWVVRDEATNKTSNKKSAVTNANDTAEEWYINCKGLPARSSIFAYFSKPYKDAETGATIFTVCQEIKFSDGENYGCVGMDIDFSELTAYVQNISLLNTGYVLLVDENGDILVNNDKNTYIDGTSVATMNFWNELSSKSQEEIYNIHSFSEKVKGEELNIVTAKDEITGWTLIGIVSQNETSSVISKINFATARTGIISLIIGIIIAICVSLSFTKEINKINVVMQKLAGGNLTNRIQVKRKDEFGSLENNYNTMVDNISVLIKDVEEKSGVIIKASENIYDISTTTTETVNQVSEAIQSVSIGTVGQAESTAKAKIEVENLAEKLHETKTYVGNISDMSVETQKLSNKGIGIADDLIKKAKQSITNSKMSKDVMAEMIESINKIDFISNAITEITEQTNLLSLNASIEAARAGDSGKGFAVVADEIRKLAEQSQSSTDEIKVIVNEISEKSNLVGKTLDDTNIIIEDQNKSIEKAKELFNSISNAVNALKDGLENIEKLNVMMDNNRVAVVDKMEEIASISTGTAAASQQVTASAQEVNATMQNLNQCTIELDEIANNLKAAIEKFEL